MPQTPHTDQQHRAILQGIAERAMLERGLLPTFSAKASAELQSIHAPAAPSDASGADAPAVGADSAVQSSDIYRARVRNRAQPTYGGVAAWLDGCAAIPRAIAAVNGLAANLHDQDRVAQVSRPCGQIRVQLMSVNVERGSSISGESTRPDREVQRIEETAPPSSGAPLGTIQEVLL